MENLISKRYIEGFNASYIITKYKPNLITLLLKNNISNDFMQGMQDGNHFYNKDKNKSLTKNNLRLQELERLRISKVKRKDRGLER